MEDEDWGGEEPVKDGSEETPPSEMYEAFEADEDLCIISNSPENLKNLPETSAEKPPEHPPSAENPPESPPQVETADDEAGLSGICPICLQHVEGEAYLDPCFHRFCFSCILHWSSTNRSANPPLCPVCKGPFLTIIHDFRGVQFKRYDVLGGQSAAQFHLSEKHVLRRGVYLEGGATKPPGFRGGFRRTNGRWLRCWVRRELQALLEEEDVEMVALHIVGSVELMAQRLKERQRFGRNVSQLRSSDGGEPELLVASLKKPPRKEKQLVFGKTSLVLSKAGLSRRKARKSVNGAMMSASPATKEVKDAAKILRKEKEREKRESAARKVMRWFNEGATHQQADSQGLGTQQEGPERASTGETAMEENVAVGAQEGNGTSENGLQSEHEGLAKDIGNAQLSLGIPAEEENFGGASQGLAENAGAGTESVKANGSVAAVETQLQTEERVHVQADESLQEAASRKRGPQSVRKKRSELFGGAGGASDEPRELTPEDKEWLEIVASQARPFVFEHADKFASELMAFLDSGLDIASYDAATLSLPAGSGSVVETSSTDLALLKRAIKEENEGDYHVEGASVERPRKKRREKQEQQYGSLWTAAKEDLAALPREGVSEEQLGPERESKPRRKKKRRGEGDEEERQRKRKHSEKSEEDSDFERRQHRKHKRRRDRHRRHRRERADSVDKSDSSLEKAVHAYRKKLRKRRKDGRRFYDGLPLSSTDDEAESWVEWRKRMKKLYRFCKTEVDEESEQSSGDSFWGDTKEARKRREEGSSVKGEGAQVREQSVSGRGHVEGSKSRPNGERSHGDWHRKSDRTAIELERKRGDFSAEQGPAGLQKSLGATRGDVTRGAKARDNCLPRRGGLKRSSGEQSGGDNLATGVSKKQVRVRWKDEETGKQPEQGVRFSDASEKMLDVGEREARRESPRNCESLRAELLSLSTSDNTLPHLNGLRGVWSESDDVRQTSDSPNEGLHWQTREESQRTPTTKRRVIVGLSELADRNAGVGAERQARNTVEETAGDSGKNETLVGFEGLQAELREVELRKKALANLSTFLKAKATAGTTGGKQMAPGVASGGAMEVARRTGAVGKKLANGQKASNGPTQAGAPITQGTKLDVRKAQTGLAKSQATVQKRRVGKLSVGVIKRSVLRQASVPPVAQPTRENGTITVSQTAVKRTMANAVKSVGKAPGKGTALGRKEPGQAGAGNAQLPGAQLVKNRVAKTQVGSQRAVPGSNQPSTPPARPSKVGGEKGSGQLSVQTNPKQVRAGAGGNQTGQSIKTGLSALQAKKASNGLAAKTAAANSKPLKGASLIAGKAALARPAPAIRPQMTGVSPRGRFKTNKTSPGVSSKLRWVRSEALTPTPTKPGNAQKPLVAQSKPASVQTSIATKSSPDGNGPLKQPKPSNVQTQFKLADAHKPAVIKPGNTSASAQPKASPTPRFAVKPTTVIPLQKPPAFLANSIGKSQGSAQTQIHRPLPGPLHVGSRTWQRTTSAASIVRKAGLTPSNTSLKWVRKEVKPDQGPLEVLSGPKTGAG